MNMILNQFHLVHIHTNYSSKIFYPPFHTHMHPFSLKVAASKRGSHLPKIRMYLLLLPLSYVPRPVIT